MSAPWTLLPERPCEACSRAESVFLVNGMITVKGCPVADCVAGTRPAVLVGAPVTDEEWRLWHEEHPPTHHSRPGAAYVAWKWWRDSELCEACETAVCPAEPEMCSVRDCRACGCSECGGAGRVLRVDCPRGECRCCSYAHDVRPGGPDSGRSCPCDCHECDCDDGALTVTGYAVADAEQRRAIRVPCGREGCIAAGRGPYLGAKAEDCGDCNGKGYTEPPAGSLVIVGRLAP